MRTSASFPLERLRAPAWAVLVTGGAVFAAGALALRPWTAVGLIAGAAILLLIATRPLVVLAGVLAIGAVDLSLLTGGYRALPFLGGLDFNGIRLAGVVGGFAALALVERDMLRHALAPYGRWFLTFLAFAAATLVFSPSMVEGVRLLLKLAFPFVVFLAVLSFARAPGEVERLGDWTLAGAAFLALVVNPIVVIAGGYELGLDGRLRVFGPGLGHTVFAWYMLAMLILAFARFTVRGGLRYLVLCGVFGAWIVLTLTRAALPAVGVGLGGMAVLAAVLNRNYRALAAAAVVGGVIAVFMVPAVLERSLGFVPGAGEIWNLARDPGALYHAINWQGRQIAWPAAFQYYLASPWTGHGMGASAVFMMFNFPQWQVVHNEYLRLAMDVGLVGGALFVAALAAWWVAVTRSARRGSPHAREFALAAAGTMLAWAVIAVTDNVFDYYAQYTQYAGFFCAAALAAGRSVAPAAPDPSPGAGEAAVPEPVGQASEVGSRGAGDG